jgi:hypothetical protein
MGHHYHHKSSGLLESLRSFSSSEIKTVSCARFFTRTFATSNLICIKSMQWLTCFMQDEIGNVYDIINGSKTNRLQPFLQPCRAFGYGNAGNAYAGIAAAGIRIFNNNFNVLSFWKSSIFKVSFPAGFLGLQ